MIASDEPWVRAPVVSPGAWKRSASIRMQRCSISAVRGYSAWSMKLRCRFSAMIRCASGSIQVVTKVARLRAGSPSSARSSATSRMASTAVMPVVRELPARHLLGDEPVAEQGGVGVGWDGLVMRSPWDGRARSGAGLGLSAVVRRWVAGSAWRTAARRGTSGPRPTRKHKAPSSVPATATRALSTSSVPGRT